MTSKLRSGSSGRLWVYASAFFAVPAYLYINLFAFSNIPFYLDGDQTFFWEYALRLLDGERIYRDFFQFTPPGTDLYFLSLFRLFGPRIWVMNFAVILLGTALCGICFSIATRLMKREMALLTTGLFLVLVYGRLLDATHHWFGLLVSLCAVRMVMPARTLPRVATAGVVFGVASWFTQTAGVVGVLALLLAILWENAEQEGFTWKTFCSGTLWKSSALPSALLLAAFGLTLAALDAQLIADIGWRRLWYFQITYPHFYLVFKQEGLFQGSLDWRGLRDFAKRCFLPASLVAIYLRVVWLQVLWRCRQRNADAMPSRDAGSENTTSLVLLSLIGLFLLLTVITRANWTRIYTVSMPGLILLMRAATRNSRTRPFIVAASMVVLVCMGTVQTWSMHHRNPRIIDLPAGRAALSEQKYEKFSWFAQHTKPGDFLFQEEWLNLYPALELRSPAFVDGLFANEVTRPEYVDLTVSQLESRKPKYILVTPGLNTPDDPDSPWQDHLGPFLAYLKTHYDFVRSFPDEDEVWKRR